MSAYLRALGGAAILLALGHQVKRYQHPDLYFGGPNAIAVGEDGLLTGVGSIRRLGGAAAPQTQGEK